MDGKELHRLVCATQGIDPDGYGSQKVAASACRASARMYGLTVRGDRPVTARVVAPWLAAVGIETVNHLDGSLDVLAPPPPKCQLQPPTATKCDPVIEAWARLGARINEGGAGWARTVRLLLEEHIGGRDVIDAYVAACKAAAGR